MIGAPPAISPAIGAQGSLCNPPQATFQPTIASIRARYSDNCTSNANLSVTLNTAVNTGAGGAGAATNCVWEWRYTFNITDACNNNTVTPVIIYTGGDVTGPVWDALFTPGFLNRNVEYCDVAALNAANALFPTATDNCTSVANIVISVIPGAFAPTPGVPACSHNGTITNTFFATDLCGRVSVAYTQVITITDNNGPIVTPAAIAAQILVVLVVMHNYLAIFRDHSIRLLQL